MRLCCRISRQQPRRTLRQRPSLSSAAYSTSPFANASIISGEATWAPCSPPAASDLFPRVSIAPMVDVTDVHFRTFVRLVSSSAHLYSEMLPAMKAISRPSSLDAPMQLSPAYHHLQMGGSSLSSLALATSFIPPSPSHCPYGSININMGQKHLTCAGSEQLCAIQSLEDARVCVSLMYCDAAACCLLCSGCPSSAAQRGGYGAVTMRDINYPHMLRTLRDISPLPISVKCRIGVDDQQSYGFFSSMIRRLVDAGIDHVIVHCRRAVLGMSPQLNRTVPPLDFQYARRIKQEWGEQLRVEVNGGIASEADVRRWMADESGVDGVMIGRWAQRNIWQCLQQIDEWTQQWRAMRGCTQHSQWQPAAPGRHSREAALSAYCAYIHSLDPHARGNQTALLVRPLLSLWQGQRGCTEWRKRLVEGSRVQGIGAVELIQWALDGVHQVTRGILLVGHAETEVEETGRRVQLDCG